MKRKKIAIEYRPINSIKPRPENPRTHSRQQIGKLVRNIKEHGFVVPIIVAENDVIIAGHGRLEAALKLGLEEVPVVELAGLSEAQQLALMISDNKLSDESSFDAGLLVAALQQIMAFDYDVELSGFDTGELNLLLNYDKATLSDEIEEFVEPDRLIPSVSRLGDTWLLGPHRLHCGNSLLAESYQAVLGGEKAQMVFADWPFNVPIKGHASGLGRVHHRDFQMASGEMFEVEFIDFLRAVMRLVVDFSIDGSLHFFCMDWRHQFELIVATKGAGYSEQKNLCVWVKSNAGMGSLYRSQHELIAVFKNGRAPHINNVNLGKNGRFRTNVWNYPGATSFGASRQADLEAHPTVKPVKMIADAILDSSKVNGLILDPFGGSGTTLRACHSTDRRCAMIEIDPHYVDVAVQRFHKATKIEAIHAETGLTFEAMRALRAAKGEAEE